MKRGDLGQNWGRVKDEGKISRTVLLVETYLRGELFLLLGNMLMIEIFIVYQPLHHHHIGFH